MVTSSVTMATYQTLAIHLLSLYLTYQTLIKTSFCVIERGTKLKKTATYSTIGLKTKGFIFSYHYTISKSPQQKLQNDAKIYEVKHIIFA